MDRRVIFDILEDERTYQDSQHAVYDETNTIADYLTYMWTYYRKAEHYNRYDGGIMCLHSLRKVAALGVACMEKNGCPSRGPNSHGVGWGYVGLTDRVHVFELVDKEREYQDKNFEFFPRVNPTVGPTLTLLRVYLWKADRACQQGGGLDPSSILEVVREITAICVRCLEMLGCPKRVTG